MKVPEEARVRILMLEHLRNLLGPAAGPPDADKDLRKHYALDSLALVSLFFQAMEALRIDAAAVAPAKFATLRSLNDIIELGLAEAGTGDEVS
jgi:hypothetical protein